MIGVGVDYGVRRIAVGLPAYGIALSLEGPMLPGTSDVETAYLMANWLVLKLSPFLNAKDAVVALEHPFVGHGNGNLNTAIRLGMVAGALGLAARRMGAQVLTVQQATWKSEVLGNGGLDKAGVAAELRRREPGLRTACRTEDEIDAMCIGLWAEQVASQATRTVAGPV